MVRTPWGDSSSLRDRKLAPGERRAPEEVARNQRERLFAAMVASVYERGYEATRIEDLVELSGVSRSDFYERFADKRACFLAALEEMIGLAVALSTEKAKAPGSWVERARNSFESFARQIVAQPAAARMGLIEVYAAGPEAIERIDGASAGFEALAGAVLRQSPERAAMPPEMIHAYTGAMQEICRTRLRRGTESELPDLMGELWDFIYSYLPPPRPLRPTRRWRRPANERIDGHSQAERVLQAFTMVTAERGYAATTVAMVVKRASTSTATFYAHFAGKRDALLAALDLGGAQVVAATLPVARRAPDWPHAIRAGLGALYSYLASRPALAHLLAVEAYVAGADALRYRGDALQPLAEFLARGHELSPETPEIAVEAISGGLHALAYRQVRDHGAASLPTLAPISAYIALAPFVGAKRACEVANGDGFPKR